MALRVGLTGGIACGKSVVSAHFEKRGAFVVDDDRAAREAVVAGRPALARIVEEFGREVLLPDGALDRAALGRIVFQDDRRRRRLMEITHPAIGAILDERFAAGEESGAPVLIYESALLVENGIAEAWRPLVVVRADLEVQVERLAHRNGLSRADALDRIHSQMPVGEKASLADRIIDNSGTIEDVLLQAEEAWEWLLRRAAEEARGAPGG